MSIKEQPSTVFRTPELCLNMFGQGVTTSWFGEMPYSILTAVPLQLSIEEECGLEVLLLMKIYYVASYAKNENTFLHGPCRFDQNFNM